MLLAALAIHAAEPIIMTNTSLDLKLSLYPAESSEEGSIVFWTNKGEVKRWGVTTASGKNYEMPVKRQYVVKQDGITKYMVKSSLNKDTFIKVFKNDLPVSVSFKIKGFANGQYATIDLPQSIRDNFKDMIENFGKKKENTIDSTFVDYQQNNPSNSPAQKTTTQSPKSQRSEQQIEAEVKKVINDWLAAEQLDSYKSFTYWENPKFKPEFFGVNDWKIIGNQYEWSEKESNFVVVMVNLSSRGGIPLKKRMTVQVYKRYGQWKIKHCRMD